MPTILDKALKHFRDFLSRVEFGTMEAGLFADSVPTVLFTRGNLTVLLRGDDADEYIQCIDELYAAVAKGEALSEANVRNLAADTFATVFQETDRNNEAFVAKADAAIANLGRLLETPPFDWEVYVPIE